MEVGIALPQYDWDGPVEWATVVEAAVRADALGFDSVWLADHLFLDPAKYGRPPGRAFGYDPLLGLAAIARVTTRVKLGTLVLCTQLRPPTVLAKRLATLDRLANGRFIAGIGAGWFEAEFAAAGVTFERAGRRVAQLQDAVTTMKAIWRGDAGAPPCNPGPSTAGGPPVWVGGKGDRVMEVAARYADGFNHGGWTDEAGPRRFDVFRATCERVGRDPDTITLSALQAIEDFGALRDQLTGFAAEGVASVIVTVGRVPFGVKTFDAINEVAAARA